MIGRGLALDYVNWFGRHTEAFEGLIKGLPSYGGLAELIEG